jgi:hypothetical protein
LKLSTDKLSSCQRGWWTTAMIPWGLFIDGQQILLSQPDNNEFPGLTVPEPAKGKITLSISGA